MEENRPPKSANRKILLGSRIRAARIDAGYRSQESFAKAIFPGVDDETDSLESKRKKISNWESGASAPNIDDLAVLCDVLNCDIGYLLGEHIGKRRETSDIMTITGLSEGAVNTLVSCKSKQTLDCVLRSKNFWEYISVLDDCIKTDAQHGHSVLIKDSILGTLSNSKPPNMHEVTRKMIRLLANHDPNLLYRQLSSEIEHRMFDEIVDRGR